MKEWYVSYVKSDGEEYLVVLPRFWKLLRWFLSTAWNCNYIVIFTINRKENEM